MAARRGESRVRAAPRAKITIHHYSSKAGTFRPHIFGNPLARDRYTNFKLTIIPWKLLEPGRAQTGLNIV